MFAVNEMLHGQDFFFLMGRLENCLSSHFNCVNAECVYDVYHIKT